jgi:hypothetical protein
MEYNKNLHLELLKRSQKLQQEGKHLYEESPEDFLKLRDLSALMIGYLHWQNREHYLELIEELLNGSIHFLPLRKKYTSINRAVELLEAELIFLDPIKPYTKAFNFMFLIDDLISLFDRYCSDPTICESHELTEEELRDSIQDMFIKIKQELIIESN